MQSQISCPQCNTPFVADLHQIIDVGQDPELKQMLLSGYLNVAQCPNCNAITQVTTPILYHDPEHELFMVHIPMEMSLQHDAQEKLIGQLVQRAMDQLPAEQRKGYMLQPQTVINLQTLIEKVLETEGVTPEMITRQRSQAGLIQTLLDTDSKNVDSILEERADEIDEGFFALLQALLDTAEQSNQEEQAIKLVNLRAKLYQATDYGRQLEHQQQVLQAFSRDVQKEGGLSPKLLLKYVLANRKNEQIVYSLISVGRSAFNYEFFVLLSERIEKRQKSGFKVDDLLALRESLLKIQEKMENQSRELVKNAQDKLLQIVESEDRVEAVRNSLSNIDELFMYVLTSSIEQAKRMGDTKKAEDLEGLHEIIIEEMNRQAPPEIRLINQLLMAESEEKQIALLDENEDLITEELQEMLAIIGSEATGEGGKELIARLQQVERLIEARINN